MNTKRIVMASLGVTGVLAGGIVSGGAWAAPDSAQACVAVTNNPTGSIHGSGGRSGCTNAAAFTITVKKDRPFQTDATVATATGSGNQIVTAYGSCSKQGSGSYYTQFDSSTGNQQQSGRVGLC